MDFARALRKGWPTAEYAVADTYDSLRWDSADIPKPTEAEIATAWASCQAGDANAPILAKIAALEGQQTPRLLREAYLSDPAVNEATGRTAAQQMAWIDGQIGALRATLSR